MRWATLRLQVAYWTPSQDRFVDAAGEPVVLPEDGGGQAVTMLERGGVPEAAIIHDAILLEEPGLIASVASAMRLAVENDRLTSEVEAQLQEVRASRSRIVEAGDRERRRIERDLHDGAQQRLISLSLELRVARTKLGEAATLTFGAASIGQPMKRWLRWLSCAIWPSGSTR